jgi:proteic killer suppression protein
MIRSFADKRSSQLAERISVRGFPRDLVDRAFRKLRQIDAAERLDDLRAPPGNRLEVLAGNRKGQHSIRINDQWRICFRWTEGGAEEVEVVDYH